MTEPILAYDSNGNPYAAFCGGNKGHCRFLVFVSSFGEGPEAQERAVAAVRKHCDLPECITCGASPRFHYSGYCDPCKVLSERASLEAAFRAATKVPMERYRGLVVAPGDDHYIEADDWDGDVRECSEVDGVRFVWGTKAEAPTVDLHRECAGWLEDHHEDAFEQVDEDLLTQAQKLVDAALINVITHYPDQSVAVIVPQDP